MAVKAQAQAGESMRGIRPVDPMRDMPAIVELVALGFEEELDPQGQKMLAEMRQVARHRTLSALTTGVELDPVGFVWVEEGCVVGNLSLRYALPGRTKGQLIGNVVVHPDYRGMGIGRALVEAAILAVQRQESRWIGLEVRENNPVACGLYTQMGFEKVGKQQHLLRPANVPWPPGVVSQLPWRVSRPRDRLLWMQLADAVYAHRQKWVLEVRPGQYTFGGLERRLNRWFEGERENAWIYGEGEARLAVCVRTDRRSRFHLWDILAHSNEGAAGAQAVVAQALQATRRFPAWPVIALVADQEPLTQALFDVGFKLHRSLVQMVMEL